MNIQPQFHKQEIKLDCPYKPTSEKSKMVNLRRMVNTVQGIQQGKY